VRALEPAHLVERLQVFSNGDQGCGETPRQIFDDDPAIALRQFENFSPPLFRQHRLKSRFRFLTFCYYFELGDGSLA